MDDRPAPSGDAPGRWCAPTDAATTCGNTPEEMAVYQVEGGQITSIVYGERALE